MLTVTDIAQFLGEHAPSVLAEEWDNVGLLVGRFDQSVSRVMTCLTITPASAAEAIARGAELIVSHHPLPFRPLKRITSETPEGRLLLDLAAARVAVYSPHTAFDSAARGINQRSCEGLNLREIAPLVPADTPEVGAGSYGTMAKPTPLRELVAQVQTLLSIPHAQAVGNLDAMVSRVAVACGSAGEFLPLAKVAGCDALVTGEVRFHTCLEAEALGMGLVLAGHFASERFGVEELAETLAKQFPALEVWPSREERDPLHWL